MNNIFRHVQSMFQSTLLLGCEAFAFAKLLTHNVAEYCPTDVVATQAEVLAHNMAAWQLTDSEWKTVHAAQTPLQGLRAHHKDLIAKKPAALKRPAGKIVKRHTFNKRRVRQATHSGANISAGVH